MIGSPNPMMVYSLGTYPGHFGEWIVLKPLAKVPASTEIMFQAKNAEEALKSMPTSSPRHAESEVSYIICLEPDHPLAMQEPSRATYEWPSPVILQLDPKSPPVMAIVRNYVVPENPVFFGCIWNYFGATALPVGIMDTRARWFSQYFQDLSDETTRALEKALHR